MKRWTIIAAALALWAVLPSASFAQTHGCACLSNRVGVPINFQFSISGGPWQTRTLNPGIVYAFCNPYNGGPRTSPPLHFQLDRDAGPGTAWTDYTIQRVQSFSDQCAQVPPEGHYYVAFQANTNNQLLVIHRVKQPAAAPAAPQWQFGCACLNNMVGQPVNFRYRLGDQPWSSATLQAGNVYSFCTPYGAGPQSWLWLHFQFDRDMGPGTAWTDYTIARVASTTNQCVSVPRNGQYFLRFQPGTNNQFIHVTK